MRCPVTSSLDGDLVARWRAENPASYREERESCEQDLYAACAVVSRWANLRIGSGGGAALAYKVIELQQGTLGAMLGRALDDHAWDKADDIVRALDHYWGARGLGEEAAAWADRILAATAGVGEDPSIPGRSLWLYTTLLIADDRLKHALRRRWRGRAPPGP